MKSMQIIKRSRRLLYLYTANVTESRRVIFFLTLVYKELLEMSLSSHFSTKVNNLLSIWVEVKLFCFVIVLWLESRTIDFWLEVKFENRRKLIYIFITRLILFIHVFSRIIWCWFNRVINIKTVLIVWSWTVRFE